MEWLAIVAIVIVFVVFVFVVSNASSRPEEGEDDWREERERLLAWRDAGYPEEDDQ